MDSTALIAVLYTYPVCLAVTLLVSHLILYHRKDASVFSQKPRSIYRLLWYLQALVCLTLATSTVLALPVAGNTIEYRADSRGVQAQIVSYIGVLLYFSAGLLPDPDGPFQPEPSNFHTWILATLFEITILSVTRARTVQSNGHTSLEASEVATSVLRTMILLVMILTFSGRTLLRWKAQLLLSNGHEQESLLGNSASNSKYDGSLTSSSPTKDAQSTGWLDYLIGFSALFPYIWPSDSPKQQALTVFCFLLMVAQRIVNVLVPWQLGHLVDALGKNRMPAKEIALYCLYRGLQGQQGVIGSIRAILWIPISQLLFRRLSCAAFEHVLLLSLDFHLSKRVGEVMSALGKGGSLNTFLDGFAFQLFPMVFDLGIAAVYLFLNFDAFYSIITIGVMWSYIFATIYMAKYRGRARRKMTTRDREMDAAKTDAIMAYETVHHNCAVPNESSKFQRLVRSFQGAEFAVLLSLNSLNALQNLIFMFGVVLVSILSAYQISQGLHKVSDFVSLITYFAQLHAPLAFFGSFYNQCQNNLVDAERMLDLFKSKPDVQDSPEATPIGECRGKISFHNVHFAYDERKPALKGISFSVNPGTTTAIVGESGTGKSTILKLLFRFYSIGKGSIKIDDKDVSEVTVQSVRDHIGVVPQDTILFNDSIMYNLLYARPGATHQEVYQACEAASIHHRILAFPEGYDTVVGERGLKLSGGEKQRVAIARAILKEPQIMLLDEATASLDSHTERQVQGALENVTRGRTTITIAHRLSTITRADQILVLHEGHIVERGRHTDLLSLRGRYWTMWERQTTVEEREKASFET